MADRKKLLILSVGYGQGHHSAAAAAAEEFASRGWECRTMDPCSEAHPGVFHLSQAYYRFCVRRAPGLWGLTYDLTETADWSRCVRWPLLKDALSLIERVWSDWQPDLVLCTYPLYAYMLDDMSRRLGQSIPYVVQVTDALAVSRPWMKSAAPLVLVTDDRTQKLVTAQYGLEPGLVCVGGFPVRRVFRPSSVLLPPDAAHFRILYACYISLRRSLRQVEDMLHHLPHAALTVLTGPFQTAFERYFSKEVKSGRLTLLSQTDAMADLFASHHVYIGKAGAATMFEAYSAEIPMLVTYALPGQEQGNLELLESDGAGCYVPGSAELLTALRELLQPGHPHSWSARRNAMRAAGRSGASKRMADIIERRFFS